jgi:predicted nucleotidyltransferase
MIGHPMVGSEQILDLSERIAREFKPSKIILFGSYASGTPTNDSDVDLLVVMPHEGESHRMAAAISSRVGHRFPTDLIVRSPQVLRQRLALGDMFLREITENGIVLHDAIDGRMGKKGRKRLQQRLAAAAVPQDARLRRRLLSRAAVRRKVS